MPGFSSTARLRAFRRPHWMAARPAVVGLASGLLMLVATLAALADFYLGSERIVDANLRSTLARAARVAAAAVDPVAHGRLRDPAQESTPEYAAALQRLREVKETIQGPEHFKYIYTCILADGKVYFILDPTAPGDADGDGVEDKSHIMEEYTDASAELVQTLREGVATVDAAPYRDRWGTFISGYAPIFDAEGRPVGAAGVDLELQYFENQRHRVGKAAVFGLIGALSLSFLGGTGAWSYHRRLQLAFRRVMNSKDEAQAADRAKSEFLATMSHEIRTPLNGVIGMTDLLSTTPLDTEQREYVETIRQSGDTLLTLINDILDFSKIEAGRLELERLPIRLKDLVRDAVRLFAAPIAAKHLSVTVDVDPACPKAFLGDPTRVRQLLLNLLGNAVKFTDRGGIAIGVKPAPTDAGQAGLEFSVVDTGIGITSEQQERLFKAFSQGDSSMSRRFGGTGLGLAVCERLVRAMGGKIRAESAGERGSAFHFTIPAEPVVEATATAALGAGAENAAALATGKPVLVVCGDRVLRTLVGRLLEKLGRTCQSVASTAEAADRLATEDAAAVIADAALSPGDPVAFASQLRSLFPRDRRPALALIASELTSDQRAQLQGLGVLAVLPRAPKLGDLDVFAMAG